MANMAIAPVPNPVANRRGIVLEDWKTKYVTTDRLAITLPKNTQVAIYRCTSDGTSVIVVWHQKSVQVKMPRKLIKVLEGVFYDNVKGEEVMLIDEEHLAASVALTVVIAYERSVCPIVSGMVAKEI